MRSRKTTAQSSMIISIAAPATKRNKAMNHVATGFDTTPAERDAILREDFHAFARKGFAILNDGQHIDDTWHFKPSPNDLMTCRTGKITRLIINAPPRSLKSYLASVALPAFATRPYAVSQVHLRELFARSGEQAFVRHTPADGIRGSTAGCSEISRSAKARKTNCKLNRRVPVCHFGWRHIDRSRWRHSARR